MIAAHGGDPCVYGGDGKTPVERLDDLGVLEHAILFHGNYMTERDLPRVLRNSASVVYCPRSHRHFGHVSHPAPLMLSRGVNVCLGTDGLVSNEGLDMVEEMLCALERCPALSPDAVLTMATLCGARALGIDGEYGALAPGMRAAFAEIPVSRWPSTP
jgi:cytosine/adenosine deaminase-related metal-dependent hydrolase